MIRAKDGDFFITDWLRNRNTLEFLSIWEQLNNPHFNYGDFALIRNKAGLNSFKISVKEWVAQTNIYTGKGYYYLSAPQSIPLIYVHQLQNLIHALTGEELTIKI